MLPDIFNRIIVNTGNLLSYKDFKKKATQSPSEEVLNSVTSTFTSFLSAVQPNELTNEDFLFCVNKAHMKVDKDERVNLKVSVKIFLGRFHSEDLHSSVSQVMEDLDVDVIDSLILSLPPLSSEEKLTLDHIKPLWIELEKLVSSCKVLTIGISDLDTAQLVELYNWSQVKPGINQVNLDSCCVMPPEMTAFAQDNDIQLLTHNDPKELVTSQMLRKILEPEISSPDCWKMSWVIRYSVLVKSRGIIQNKGYLLNVVKDT